MTGPTVLCKVHLKITVFICVCSTCVLVWMCAHMWRSEVDFEGFLPFLATQLFETKALTEPTD